MSYIGSLIIENPAVKKAEIAPHRIAALWEMANELLPTPEKVGAHRFLEIDLPAAKRVEITETTVYGSHNGRTHTTVMRTFAFDRGNDTYFSVTLRATDRRLEIAHGAEHFVELEKALRSANEPGSTQSSAVR